MVSIENLGRVTIFGFLVSAGTANAESASHRETFLNAPPHFRVESECGRLSKVRAIRIVLNRNLDAQNPYRDIVEKGLNSYQNDEDNGQGVKHELPNPPYTDSTPLDLDLTPYLTDQPTLPNLHRQAVLIKIVLKDHTYTFRPGDDAIGTPYNDGMFCGVEHGMQNRHEIVKFYAVYLKGKPHPYIGQFDIGLVKKITDGNRIVQQYVYVDPKVGNNGLALVNTSK